MFHVNHCFLFRKRNASFRSFFLTKSTFCSSNTFLLHIGNFRFILLRFRITAPAASHWASFQKQDGPNTRTIVKGIMLYVKNIGISFHLSHCLMLCSGNNVILQILCKLCKIGTVAGNSNQKVLVILRMFLCFSIQQFADFIGIRIIVSITWSMKEHLPDCFVSFKIMGNCFF